MFDLNGFLHLVLDFPQAKIIIVLLEDNSQYALLIKQELARQTNL